jgi:hypothetical protein
VLAYAFEVSQIARPQPQASPSDSLPDQPPAGGTGAPTGELSDAQVDAMTDEQAEEGILSRSEPVVVPAVTLTLRERLEAFVARLSTRNNFWHRVCSLIWLPYAFKSGIHMKRLDGNSFAAVLPFRRFNRNWYNAMAGAALLANSEIAGGMYIFGITGGDYTLVCKQLEYKFLRPCFGPAVYRVTPSEDLRTLMATRKEFNLTLELEVIQQPLVPAVLAKVKKQDRLLAKLAAKERRVGRCVATFHLTPTVHQKAKRGDARKVG